ncbi:MAG: hypothetical protein IIC51_02120 [Planctomycetes bacterium]|nr:hypothetical protein [Planctomycetota bacterium]MCH9002632.1 hypothetical protein [Planctomycetota bacterium]MCH9033406.1 hypothetical protein [Planctomycetota bacterium]
MKRGILASAALVFVSLLGGSATAAPQAQLVSMAWQLDFEFHDPQRIDVALPGDSRPTTYWYVLYQVTNNTNREVDFYPSIQLVTDTLQVVSAGDTIPLRVYDAIARRHGREYPFFVPATEAAGRLLQGEENARASAAVFRNFDRTASSFTFFVAGLSGEIELIGNPAFDAKKEESTENPLSFLFRRTLAIKYDIPGDPVTRSGAVPQRRSREWVMR